MERRTFFKNLGAALGAVMIAPNISIADALSESPEKEIEISRQRVKGTVHWFNDDKWILVTDKIKSLTQDHIRETVDVSSLDDLGGYREYIERESQSKFNLTTGHVSDEIAENLINSNGQVMVKFILDSGFIIACKGYVYAISINLPQSQDTIMNIMVSGPIIVTQS